MNSICNQEKKKKGEGNFHHSFPLSLILIKQMDKEGSQEGRACGSRSSKEQDYLLGVLTVRLQLPEDISPDQMARWELKYQASRVQRAGLQVP